ncbi:hypothetical protein BU23DRAFT_587132 [Bimuria novae-zelandiae CBS 107.79]|uniref:S-adenosyl-L-methionine-dependent methyltransferase n=1 Tax=Bimuria novae-zelandiae CBS 107.79 TaxID=1447943 RepID=A0A6A5VQZ0_9PLEO|nr:hypothetical protein BU23DRAFT_587132 [Bimuria novae-zelandiae CBS 107.79]
MPPPPWIMRVVPFPSLLGPSFLLGLGMYHFTATILEINFIKREPRKLLNLTQTYNGTEMSQDMPGPLDDLVIRCRGVVSIWTGLRTAEECAKGGLWRQYHALLYSGEPESLIPALHKSGILGTNGTAGAAENGVFDEICCLRVLCGVPHPKETIQGLYSLLKPGGRVVVRGHFANPWRTEGSIVGSAMQFLYSVAGWSFFLGGCELQRHTAEFLREAGEWDKIQLQCEDPKGVIPFVVGELIKKR